MAGKHFLSDALLSLRASSSQAIGNEAGASVDMGGGVDKICRAIVTVTVVGTSATLAVKLQGSSDNSTFYDIPGAGFLDPADGAAIDAVGQYEVYFKSDFRYIRTYGTAGTAAVTWSAELTTAH